MPHQAVRVSRAPTIWQPTPGGWTLWFGLAWCQSEHLFLLVTLKSDRPVPVRVSVPQCRASHHSLPLLRDSSRVSRPSSKQMRVTSRTQWVWAPLKRVSEGFHGDMGKPFLCEKPLRNSFYLKESPVGVLCSMNDLVSSLL